MCIIYMWNFELREGESSIMAKKYTHRSNTVLIRKKNEWGEEGETVLYI